MQGLVSQQRRGDGGGRGGGGRGSSKGRGGGRGKGGGDIICYHCQKPGHTKPHCPDLKKAHPRDESVTQEQPNSKRRKGKGNGKGESGNIAAIINAPAQPVVSGRVASTQAPPHPATALRGAADGREFCIDSGASQHMMQGRASTLSTPHSSHTAISLGDGRIVKAVAEGSYGILKGVLAAPQLAYNLLSVHQATTGGHTAVFTETGMALYPTASVAVTGQPVLQGLQRDGLYYTVVQSEPATQHACIAGAKTLVTSTAPKNKFTLWHQRLGHISVKAMRNILHAGAVLGGFSYSKAELHEHTHEKGICTACALGKMTFKAVRRERKKPSAAAHATAPGRLVYADLFFSPYFARGEHSGSTMALLLVDADTRYKWVYFLKAKTDVPAAIREWVEDLVAQGITVKAFTTLKTDNGGEFTGCETADVLRELYVKHETSAPYGHVAVVERAIRSVKECARAMLLAAELSGGYWAEAVHTAVYTLNRVSGSNDPSKTPYEALRGTKPDLSNLRTFGCKVFCKVQTEVKDWRPVAFEGVFVGYDETCPSSWRCLSLVTGTISKSRNVIFDETRLGSKGSSPITAEEAELFAQEVKKLFPMEGDTPVPTVPPSAAPVEDVPFEAVGKRTRSGTKSNPRILSEADIAAEIVAPREHEIGTNLMSKCLATRVKSKTERFTPKSIHAANASEHAAEWSAARDDENSSLVKNDVLEVQERPRGIQVLPLFWLFKIKEAADGSIARFKARCTVLGNLQQEGINFDEIFAPVVRYATMRILFAIAGAVRNLSLHQMDVNTAFLYGVMPASSAVYVSVPEGYPIPEHLRGKTNLCCRVKRALYGLKQSPRLWYKNIDATFKTLGFSRCAFDPCLYYRQRAETELYVTVYVDDLVMAGSSDAVIMEFKAELSARYDMKDLGEVQYVLSMEVSRDRAAGTIEVSQCKYITDVLRRFGMLECHAAPTPMDPAVKLVKAASTVGKAKAKAEDYPYQEVVGSLMYLMVTTRPDIAYAVSQLARYMSCHGPQHHEAAKRVLRYLKGTMTLGLTYGTSKDLTLQGFSDSDWGGNTETRRSTTGYAFMLAGGAVSWASKTQKTVALSSTEAEYMALTETAKEAIHLRQTCEFFGFSATDPILLHEDNMGAKAMAENVITTSASKHINIRHHFIREKVADGDVMLVYVRTERQLADALTKALHKVTFLRLRGALLGYAPLPALDQE